MDNQDNITISKYINGELAGTELAEFEKLLQQDKALKNEVDFHKIVDETLAENYQATSKIDDSERLEFEGILSKVMESELVPELVEDRLNEEETPDQPTTSNTLIRRLVPFAALAAAAALLLFLIPSLQNNDSKLADNFYKPYAYQVEPTLSNDNLDGLNAYQNKNYETALDFFINNPSGDLKVHLAKGNAEYNLAKYDEAITSFKNVIERTDVASFKNYANWYLALTYLKKRDKDKAIKLLETLPESADFYNQAQNLSLKIHRLFFVVVRLL